MKTPKVRELIEALRSLFGGPATSAFPAVMPKVPEGLRGFPVYHEESCTGCGACAQVCEGGAIKIVDEGPKRKLEIHYDSCCLCGQCERACIADPKGISMTTNFDKTTAGSRHELRESIEKDMILCELCGVAVAPADQISFVAARLGTASFSNPTLFLASLKQKNLVDANLPHVEKHGTRSDRMKILCQDCRRRTTLNT